RSRTTSQRRGGTILKSAGSTLHRRGRAGNLSGGLSARHGSIVITSGQCGFRDDLSISPRLDEQIEMTLLNAQKTLRAAGVDNGLTSVYQITLYALQIDDELVRIWREMKRKYMGSHAPVETGVTVPALYGGAKVEMTFYAVGG
ncbi:endoribonuclease l-psp, partial [Colletotrichum asianum]